MNTIRRLLIGAALLLATSASAVADVAEVDNDALKQLIEQGVPVIDVRRVDEWEATGVIDGVHTLTFFDKQGSYDAKKWLAELDKIAPKGTPVVLICEAGVRSKTIAKFLDKRLGYSGVHNHTRGMSNWIGKGQPVVKYTPEQAPTAKSETKP